MTLSCFPGTITHLKTAYLYLWCTGEDGELEQLLRRRLHCEFQQVLERLAHLSQVPGLVLEYVLLAAVSEPGPYVAEVCSVNTQRPPLQY